MRDTGWFKSTRSTSGGDNCVEVRFTDDVSRVRDSKNSNAILSVDLLALVRAIKSGHWDQ